jgi:thymidylate kinase
MKILYLEGIAGSGKSTLIKILANEGYPAFSELGDFFGLKELPSEGRNLKEIKKTIRWFIRYESKRTKSAGIYDRGYLSHLAFYPVFEKLIGIRGCADLCDKLYTEAIQQGKIKRREGIILLDTSTEQSLENIKRKEDKGAHKLPEYWHDTDFLTELAKTYKLLIQRGNIPSLIITDNDLEKRKNKVIKFWGEINDGNCQ